MKKRNKIAQWLFDYCYKGSLFLYKHPVIYWILQFTWGIIYTIIGSIIGFFAIVVGGTPYIFHRHYMIMIGDNWGGLELGLGGLVANNMGDSWTFHTKCHEAGHCYQNALLGPFTIFLVVIPSAVRYWYQRIRTKKGLSNTPYDDIWFEGSATIIGIELYSESKLEA